MVSPNLKRAALGLALPCALVIAYQRACDYLDPCRNQQITNDLSPNGDRRSWLFVRDCGATTGFTSQITVLDAEAELPRKAGNTVIIELPLGASHSDVHVSWKSHATLHIAYPRGSQLLHRHNNVDGVAINYQEISVR